MSTNGLRSKFVCAIVLMLGGILPATVVAEAGVLNASWIAPTTNADGSSLTDLGLYRVYYSTSSTPCPGPAFFSVASSTTTPPANQTVNFRLTGLATGSTYSVAITALDLAGNESPCSGVASAVAQLEIGVTPTATTNFANVNIGSSATQSFTVTSTRSGTVTGFASVAAPFSIVSGSPFTLVGSGATATVTVRFTPTSTAVASTNVNFTADGDTVSRLVVGAVGSLGSSAPAPPASAPSATDAQNVTWTNLVNVTANGNSVTKTTGCDGCFDAGAISQQTIAAGDGYTQFTAGTTGPLSVVGLARSFVSDPGSIAFGIRFQGNVAEIREGGVYRTDTSFVAGDSFRVAIQSGVVRYSKNGTVFYTSGAAPAYPLVLAAALANRNGVVGRATISGAGPSSSPSSSPPGSGSGSAPSSVAWLNPVNVIVSGSSLTKTTGCAGCNDAGAVSQQQITGANGYAQFTAGATGPLRVAGLAQGFSVTNPATIAFGIRMQGNIADVREGGVYRTDVVFAAGDVFRISVQAGVVSYFKNGTVFYTSNQSSTAPMAFGVVINDLNGAIGSAVVSNGL